MPIFDPLLRKLITRVVYDGPGFSGKTTNVTCISRAMPVEKRTEVYTPGALKGRTMFFDWLEVDVGKLGKMPLSCQILSVPGQRARSYRRRPLIMLADAIVFVADCTQMAETKRSYGLLKRYLRERQQNVPYLVQCNKQDDPAALRPDAVARTLRVSSPVLLVSAAAARGQGVRETFEAAVRAAVRFTAGEIQARGLAAFAGERPTADALFETLLELEDTADVDQDLDFDEDEEAVAV